MKRVKYTIANWKMNGGKDSIKLVKLLVRHIKKTGHIKSKVIICPPYTLLSDFIRLEKKMIYGAQDCHYQDKGAYTGSISAQMIKSIGCKYVIIGHSERREYQKESSNELRLKIQAAINNNMRVIYCIGEKLSEIKNRMQVLKKQISTLNNNLDINNIIIAYEPIWAIGSGKTPKIIEINSIHKNIRTLLSKKFGVRKSNKISILYGGSVNSLNASDILKLEHVDGALVGGASLKYRDFSKIIDSYY